MLLVSKGILVYLLVQQVVIMGQAGKEKNRNQTKYVDVLINHWLLMTIMTMTMVVTMMMVMIVICFYQLYFNKALSASQIARTLLKNYDKWEPPPQGSYKAIVIVTHVHRVVISERLPETSITYSINYVHDCVALCAVVNLTHWPPFSPNSSSWTKLFNFRLIFHWILFLMVLLTINLYWFR